jgi:hypothetical protein
MKRTSSNNSMKNNISPPKGRIFRWKRITAKTDLPYDRVEGHAMCSIG